MRPGRSLDGIADTPGLRAPTGSSPTRTAGSASVAQQRDSARRRYRRPLPVVREALGRRWDRDRRGRCRAGFLPRGAREGQPVAASLGQAGSNEHPLAVYEDRCLDAAVALDDGGRRHYADRSPGSYGCLAGSVVRTGRGSRIWKSRCLESAALGHQPSPLSRSGTALGEAPRSRSFKLVRPRYGCGMRSRPARGPRTVITPAVIAWRSMHGLIAAGFLASIGYVWWCALTGRRGRLLRPAIAALAGEGILVVTKGGDCPLGPLGDRIGDQVPLFELVLSPVARRAVPTLGAVSALGIGVLAARSQGATITSASDQATARGARRKDAR